MVCLVYRLQEQLEQLEQLHPSLVQQLSQLLSLVKLSCQQQMVDPSEPRILHSS